MKSLFEQLGGEAALRPIIATFVDRMFDDPMIGFFFRGVDRRRIVTMEFEFTAALLGAEIRYSGRPIEQAHARHPINEGHFARRLQILRETLDEYGVPREIRKVWLTHTESLRPLVIRGGPCVPRSLPG